jgi:class 3 adenylate cyclase
MEAHHAQATATGDLPASATSGMTETRKLAAILVADIVGYSRLAGADEDRILARVRTLRSDLIDPTIAVHHGRTVKRTGDASVIEFRSVVDAVNCAIEVKRAMVERNAEVAPDKRIEFRVGIHLGDVVEESDGDDGRRREYRHAAAKHRQAGRDPPLPASLLAGQGTARTGGERSRQHTTLKNIAEPVHAYSVEVGKQAQSNQSKEQRPEEFRWPS